MKVRTGSEVIMPGRDVAGGVRFGDEVVEGALEAAKNEPEQTTFFLYRNLSP